MDLGVLHVCTHLKTGPEVKTWGNQAEMKPVSQTFDEICWSYIRPNDTRHYSVTLELFQTERPRQPKQQKSSFCDLCFINQEP